MTEFEAIYDGDGEQVAWAAEAADDAIVALDDDGNVIGAVDPETGEALDPDDYTLVTEDPADEDPYPELTERLEELEARANEPMQVEDVADDGYDPVADLTLQADHAEAILGRPLTLDERRRIFREAQADLVSGERPDLGMIAERLEDLGEPIADLDSGHRGRDHVARTELIAQRLADQERVADAEDGYDDLAEPEPPQTQAVYDLDDRAERHAYLADRLRDSGADPSDTYSSSDLAEQEWE